VPNDLDAIIRLAPRAPRCKRCARVAAKAVQILGELEAES
jgi:hypothetical protein